MNYKVSISEQAEKDLNDIYSYIRYKLKSKAGADRIAQKLYGLYGAMASLSAMPKRFRLHSAEPWLSRGLRFNNSYRVWETRYGKCYKIKRFPP